METGGVKWGIGEDTRGSASMFMGEYQHNLDEKGRITVPARFREELGTEFVMTKGLDQCLFIYPLEEWESITEKLRQLPFTRSDARAFVRLFFSGAAQMSFDSQGRALIPNNLREYADLGKEAVIIGVGARIEIWGNEEWSRFQDSTEASYEELAEELTDLGSLL